MSDAACSSTPPGEDSQPGSVVLLFKTTAMPDAELAVFLESYLRRRGYTVLMDRKPAVGLTWARRFESWLLEADLVVVLVSAASAQSELLAYELEMAIELAEQRGGLPQVLPVRVFYRGPLSEGLASRLHPLEFEWDSEAERYVSRMVTWQSTADDEPLGRLIGSRLTKLAQTRQPAEPQRAGGGVPPVPSLEPVGGAMALESKFYIQRPTDRAFEAAVGHRESLVLIKGARQMGKTSLLARGLQQARQASARVVLTDLQKLQTAHFASLGTCYLALAEMIADQLDIAMPERALFEENANRAFERFWSHALERSPQPVLWAIDEFDRLFPLPFGGEVCGLLRSWHNARALDPVLPWGRLTIAIAYATEAQLFISDLSQSPFNVGTRLALEDFSLAEMAELNDRYGRPLRHEAEIIRLRVWLGGQPYLVRCAMNEMASHQEGIARVERLVDLDESVFGEHLRRLLYSVGRDPAITNTVRALLFQGTAPPPDRFHRLRSAGVLVGGTPSEARLRCGLYERFLRRHLVQEPV
jgi:hypothetical protein